MSNPNDLTGKELKAMTIPELEQLLLSKKLTDRYTRKAVEVVIQLKRYAESAAATKFLNEDKTE
jgi:hypothetical protein